MCSNKSPANKVNLYSFNSSISLEVLNNYLDKSINYNMLVFGPDIVGFDEAHAKEAVRFITNVGAKYIARAGATWYASKSRVNAVCMLKSSIEDAHKIDPDIIFEAAIFETTLNDISDIPVPSHVYEAFGQSGRTNMLNVDDMLYKDGSFVNHWDKGVHVPDITRTETQIYFYTLATKYIDAGFEALHLGQVNLMGKNDTDNHCWEKVVKMIREYAKTHARRGYVIINSHASKAKYHDSNGIMLWDLRMFPSRVHAPEGSEYHLPTSDNPQICIIEKGYWGESIYQAGISGTSPSGWYTENYPYLAEFDNYEYSLDDIGNPNKLVWGMDETSWFCIQPDWYRWQFMKDIRDKISSFNENGHISLNAHRGFYYDIFNKKKVLFFANNKSAECPTGLGDEDAIKSLFANR